MLHRRGTIASVVTAILVLAANPAAAQAVACRTTNCETGTDAGGNPILPAECQDRATPRLIEVQMTSGLVFNPTNPRIEGLTAAGTPWAYQCIQWHTVGLTIWHSSTEDVGCDLLPTCLAPQTMPALCEWESGEINNPTEFAVCHYADVAPAAYLFHCRLHGAAGGIGMAGQLVVVDAIELAVDKNNAGDVILDWAAGGVGPWDVFRDHTAPMPSPTNLTPAGTILRTLTDPQPPGDKCYLVMERN